MQVFEPYTQRLMSETSKTASFSSSVLSVPLLEDYTFIAVVANVSGTSPTLSIDIQPYFDSTSGSFQLAKFSQFTAAGTKKLMLFPVAKNGSAIPGTDLTKFEARVTSANTSAVSGFMPTTELMKIAATIGGTSPSFDITIWLIGNPRQIQ